MASSFCNAHQYTKYLVPLLRLYAFHVLSIRLSNVKFRVVDEDLQVRVAATGALRNLAIVGGETVCTQILEANVLLPVLSVLTQMHHKLVMNMVNICHNTRACLHLLLREGRQV